LWVQEFQKVINQLTQPLMLKLITYDAVYSNEADRLDALAHDCRNQKRPLESSVQGTSRTVDYETSQYAQTWKLIKRGHIPFLRSTWN
jgi:hypothetical protein